MQPTRTLALQGEEHVSENANYIANLNELMRTTPVPDYVHGEMPFYGRGKP
jgi:hypothetical protein